MLTNRDRSARLMTRLCIVLASRGHEHATAIDCWATKRIFKADSDSQSESASPGKMARNDPSMDGKTQGLPPLARLTLRMNSGHPSSADSTQLFRRCSTSPAWTTSPAARDNPPREIVHVAGEMTCEAFSGSGGFGKRHGIDWYRKYLDRSFTVQLGRGGRGGGGCGRTNPIGT